MYSYIISIDQGTHSTRAIIYDRNGTAIFYAKEKIMLNYLEGFRVEQDGYAILESCQNVLQAAHQYVLEQDLENIAVAISTQRSSVIAWNANTGEALCPVLSWLDTRAQESLYELDISELQIKSITGLPLSPHYGASKIQWLLEYNESVKNAYKQNNLILGPLAAFIIFNLVKDQPAYVDYVNAHRTLLWNLHTCEWDTDILSVFGIDKALLPKPVPNAYQYGELKGYDYPLVLVSGDQNSSVYGHANSQADVAFVNIGTGGFVLVRCLQLPAYETDLLVSIAFSSKHEKQYVLEGTINGAGASLSWAKNAWSIENIEDIEWGEVDNIPIFLNTVGGLGSPWWKSNITPGFSQKNKTYLDYSSQQCKAALMESIIFLIYKNLQEMHKHDVSPEGLVISGGMSADKRLCQCLCDLSKIPVMVSQYEETTSRGAAWLALGKPVWEYENTHRLYPGENAALEERYHEFVNEMQRLVN